jgi:hypothetical protein
LNVLIGFFARSDTATTFLTKVTLHYCDFGSEEDTSRLLTTFHANRTVTDLTIRGIDNLEGTALGNSLSGLLHKHAAAATAFSRSSLWFIGVGE